MRKKQPIQLVSSFVGYTMKIAEIASFTNFTKQHLSGSTDNERTANIAQFSPMKLIYHQSWKLAENHQLFCAREKLLLLVMTRIGVHTFILHNKAQNQLNKFNGTNSEFYCVSTPVCV